MYGIFRECVVILQQYGGGGFYLLLYLTALGFLFVRERRRHIRIVLVIVPLILLACFLLPVTRIVFVAAFDEGDTYYRILWLIPMGMTIAYAGVRALSYCKKRLFCFLLMVSAILLCGKYVYRKDNPYISRAQNAYHLPQVVIELADAIRKDQAADLSPSADRQQGSVPGQTEGKKEEGNTQEMPARVRAAFPSELVYFVRQYDTNILLPFGRDMVEARWGYYDPVHEEMERQDGIVMRKLNQVLRKEDCTYLVLNNTKKIDASPEAYGYLKIGTFGDYTLYRDTGALKQLHPAP